MGHGPSKSPFANHLSAQRNLGKYAHCEGAVTTLQRILDMMPRKQLSVNTSAESGSVIYSRVLE
jgi:hypothetical protein